MSVGLGQSELLLSGWLDTAPERQSLICLGWAKCLWGRSDNSSDRTLDQKAGAGVHGTIVSSPCPGRKTQLQPMLAFLCLGLGTPRTRASGPSWVQTMGAAGLGVGGTDVTYTEGSVELQSLRLDTHVCPVYPPTCVYTSLPGLAIGTSLCTVASRRCSKSAPRGHCAAPIGTPAPSGGVRAPRCSLFLT